MTFSVPFRHFDYTEWYPELLRDPRGLGAPVYTDTWELPKRESDTVEELYPNPEIVFPAHNPDPAKSLSVRTEILENSTWSEILKIVF